MKMLHKKLLLLILLLILPLTVTMRRKDDYVVEEQEAQMIRKEHEVLPQAMDVTLEWSYQTGGWVSSSPCVADLDGDGTLEVLVGYDNVAIKGFISGWGFSALIERDNKKILFDTGWDGNALLKNIQRAKFDPKDIDFVVISHKHWDHLGGLSSILNEANNPTVFVPSSLSSKLKAEITKFGGIREVTTNSGEEVIPGIKTTAELIAGGTLQIREISLMIETKKGLVVVCGCAHPGLETILDYCKKFGNIYAAIGGFHGFDKLARLQNIELIVPCHCTRKKGEILKKYPQNSHDCYVGLKLDFE